MAQQVDEKEEKREDFSKYFDYEKEKEQMVEAIKIALLEVDNNTGKEVLNPDNVWTVFNTKTDSVQVVYRLINADAGVYTIRGTTTLNISVDDMYDFMNCSFDGEQEVVDKMDKLQKEWRCIKNFDENHRCLYNSFDTGFPSWIISPRDFCFMKSRGKFDQYTIKIGDKEETYNMAVSYMYSVEEDHPCYEAVQKGHVRGKIWLSSYVYYQKANATEEEKKSCNMAYIVSVDPCGSIPQRVVNYSAPLQGMNAKEFADNQDLIRETINKNRQQMSSS